MGEYHQHRRRSASHHSLLLDAPSRIPQPMLAKNRATTYTPPIFDLSVEKSLTRFIERVHTNDRTRKDPNLQPAKVNSSLLVPYVALSVRAYNREMDSKIFFMIPKYFLWEGQDWHIVPSTKEFYRIILASK